MDESFLSSRTGRAVDEPDGARSSVPVARPPADFQDLVRTGVITRVLILVYIWIQELRDITPPGCTCHLLFIEIYLPYVFTFFMLALMRFELLWVCFSITSCFSSYKQHVGLTKGKLTSGFQLESCEERRTFWLSRCIWPHLDHKQYSNLWDFTLNLAAVWTSAHLFARMSLVMLFLVVFGFKFYFILTCGKHLAVPSPRFPPVGFFIQSSCGQILMRTFLWSLI